MNLTNYVVPNIRTKNVKEVQSAITERNTHNDNGQSPTAYVDVNSTEDVVDHIDIDLNDSCLQDDGNGNQEGKDEGQFHGNDIIEETITILNLPDPKPPIKLKAYKDDDEDNVYERNESSNIRFNVVPFLNILLSNS